MIRPMLFTAAAVAIAVTPACAQQEGGDMSRADVEDIVREYILENPEIIEEALIILTERQQAEEDAQAQAAIASRADDLYKDARDFSIGPEDADVQIVEFFDYRCGYCKASLDWVQGLPEKHDGKVRVIFKEFPILSAESEQAALAALAAGKQGKYNEMHSALMKSRSAFKAADIDRIAESVDVDVERMRADMKLGETRSHLNDVRNLAQEIGTSATPTFIINGELVAGFDRSRLEAMIEDATS